MAKSTGLGSALYLQGVDLSGDTQSFEVSGPQATIDMTDITKSANVRLGGKRDGKINWVSFFDAATSHPTLSALPTTDVLATVAIAPTVGSQAACCLGKQLNYDGTRTNTGEYTFKVEVDADGSGLEWGNLLTAGVRTDSAATNGASIDTTASAAFGWQAYLHVVAFTGTDVTVKIQDSADNSSFTDLASAAFTQITGGAPSSQRITAGNGSTATVRRYLRASTVTTGGFTNLQFVVVVVKNAAVSVSM